MRWIPIVLAIATMTLTGCNNGMDATDAPNLPVKVAQRSDLEPIEIVPGRTVYVPAYTGIRYYDEGKIYPLAVTLSVRNRDPERVVIIERVDFFGSEGQFVDRYLTEPYRIEPMATAEFFVPERDMRGGSGANFIVTWSSNGPVHEPLIESVMIGTSGTQGISFTASGVPYGDRTAE
jgi:hypothetical protein